MILTNNIIAYTTPFWSSQILMYKHYPLNILLHSEIWYRIDVKCVANAVIFKTQRSLNFLFDYPSYPSYNTIFKGSPIIAGLAKSLTRRRGAIVFSSQATKKYHHPARQATLKYRATMFPLSCACATAHFFHCGLAEEIMCLAHAKITWESHLIQF